MSLVSHYPENMELLESINIYFIPNLQALKRFTPLFGTKRLKTLPGMPRYLLP